MYSDPKFKSRTSVIDEFSIYERKLEPEEISNHYRYCVIPSGNAGWDRKNSHRGDYFLNKHMNYNDTVSRLLGGSVKGYPTMDSSGIKTFEVRLGFDEASNPNDWFVTRGTGFGVGVSDTGANETGLMQIDINDVYPCFENHIMLWALIPSEDGDDGGYEEYNESPDESYTRCFLSVALYGVYKKIPIPDTENGEIFASYETNLVYTIALDYDRQIIMFYANGRIVTVYDFSEHTLTPNFRPTFSSDLDRYRQQS